MVSLRPGKRRQADNSDQESSRDDESKDQKKVKSRRPPNTAFRQQRLKAWQPILTPKTVLPLFFIVGVIFAPLGGLLLYASSQVQELVIDYTDCSATAPSGTRGGPIPSGRVSHSFSSSSSNGTLNPDSVLWSRILDNSGLYGNNQPGLRTNSCTIYFNIPNDLDSPVYLYYRLTRFYQNHRRYVKSFDQDQLNGDFRSNSSINSGDCDPLQLDANGFAYYPCGLIANSMFNDTIHQPQQLDAPNTDKPVPYNMTNVGIAWGSDAKLYGNTSYKFYDVVPPPNWRERYPSGYNESFPIPDLGSWEEFQVWMRTAGLPTFSKLALRNDNNVMKAGTYSIRVEDRFPASLYGGTKSIVISTRTVIGGKNPYLGIAYVVVGGICVVLGAVFTATHLIKPRKLGDHTYLTWNNEHPTPATAASRNLRPNDAA